MAALDRTAGCLASPGGNLAHGAQSLKHGTVEAYPRSLQLQSGLFLKRNSSSSRAAVAACSVPGRRSHERKTQRQNVARQTVMGRNVRPLVGFAVRCNEGSTGSEESGRGSRTRLQGRSGRSDFKLSAKKANASASASAAAGEVWKEDSLGWDQSGGVRKARVRCEPVQEVRDSRKEEMAAAKISASKSKMVTITVHGVSSPEEVERLSLQVSSLPGVLSVLPGPTREGGLRGGSVPLQVELPAGMPLKTVLDAVHGIEERLLALPFKTHSWRWRGHKINYAVAGCGKPIILVHGFGGSAGHFRHLIALLADHHRVYAVDLLGFGDSDKPRDAEYGPELWADIINDFTSEFADEPPILIGNSIGSLTSLTAAAAPAAEADTGERYRGVVLLNVAGAMNRKGLERDDAVLRLLSPIFVAIEFLLQRPKVADWLFNRFSSKANIRRILEQQVYRNKGAVDDRLLDILTEPSLHPGAVDVFVKVFTGDPGPHPRTLVEKISIPMLVLWGDADPWTPIGGAVAKLFTELEEDRGNVAVIPLEDVGHCPHDDRPELVAQHVLPWMKSLDG